MDNLDRENFILDLIAVDKIASDNNVNYAFSDILESTNNIIDKYIPSRKINNEEYKRKDKPWITRGILKSNDQKKELYRQFVKYKGTKIKEDTYTKYKVIKNRITDIIRISKQNFHKNYFTENYINLRKIWLGIKELINIKTKRKIQ